MGCKSLEIGKIMRENYIPVLDGEIGTDKLNIRMRAFERCKRKHNQPQIKIANYLSQGLML